MNIDIQKQREPAFQKLELLSSLGQQTPIELFQECLAHPYQFIRIEAIRRVSEYSRQDFIWLFAIALNDKCEYVVEEAAHALARLKTDQALEILKNAFFQGTIERPHHIANAISQFGKKGFDVLIEGTKNPSPNIRYYSAKLLGSTGFEEAGNILEEMEKTDHAKTSFSGLVSTAARKGLKTLAKKLDSKNSNDANRFD